MFKDRAIQVGLVKRAPIASSAPSVEPANNDKFESRMACVSVNIEPLIKKVTVGVVAYVLVDTFRKVMIENAKKAAS